MGTHEADDRPGLNPQAVVDGDEEGPLGVLLAPVLAEADGSSGTSWGWRTETGYDELGRPIAVRHRQDPGWGTGTQNDGVWQGPSGQDPGKHDRLTTYAYANDSDGRPAELGLPEGVLGYEYDAVTGRHTRTTASHDDGNGGLTLTTEVGYDHDKLGRLVQVAAAKLNGNTVSSTTGYAYFAHGQLARQGTDGVVSTWGYDPLGRLLRLETESGLGQLAHYALDKAGHRLRIDETIDPDPTTSNDEFSRTAEYEYDQLYRLTKETVTDVLVGTTTAFEQSYTFDLAGNRLRKIISTVGGNPLPSGWTAGSTTSTYNARDQLLSTVTGAATTKFGYDANGSLTTRKNGSDALLFRQGYDLKNRLVEADADGNGTADLRLAYDHQEGRVARHTTGGTGAVTAVVGSEHYLFG